MLDGSELASKVTISGNNSVSVFSIVAGNTASLNNLIITDGSSVSGAGIYNNGSLTLINCLISGNISSYNGGGISNNGILTVIDSIISDNSAKSDGGGVYNSSNGMVTITNSTLSNNMAESGGGISSNSGGSVTVANGIFSNNSAEFFGGGINIAATMIILDSTFSNNSAGDGGGISHGDQHLGMKTATVTNSTFSGNSATNGRGGGIYNDDGAMEITNSTFVGNSSHWGGAIFNSASIVTTATLTVTNSTFSENSAVSQSGGIYNIGMLNLKNSILANSIPGGDCYNNNGFSGTIGIDNNNLIETNATAPHACGAPLLASDPLLGSLQDNGGFTQTMAIPSSSPAIDTGDNISCAGEDQRGYPRPLDGDDDTTSTCDIGAFEYSPHLIVVSIKRVDVNPTDAVYVDYLVRFSTSVNNVESSDFALTTTGVTGSSITNVSGSGEMYTVTVDTGSGNGTIRLDVVDDDTIEDNDGNKLGGTGAGNGSLTSGEVYDVFDPMTFNSVGSQDGWILESSEISGKGGTLNNTATLLYVGDDAKDKQYRSILSFDTSGLPDGAVITNVQLKIKVQGFVGGNMFIPTKTLGNLLIDIRSPYFGTGADLVVSDFQKGGNVNAVGILKSMPTTGWYTVTLKDTAYNFVNLTDTTQFRLRFSKDDNDDLGNDYLKIFSGDASAASRPQLIVEYYVP